MKKQTWMTIAVLLSMVGGSQRAFAQSTTDTTQPGQKDFHDCPYPDNRCNLPATTQPTKNSADSNSGNGNSANTQSTSDAGNGK